MNLKLNNDQLSPARAATGAGAPLIRRAAIKEERRRTGRYIAILVGISLLFLALYQAWVRRIPVVASLVVPALIMFAYIAWVLYTASRDKRKRERDLERAMIESFSSTPPEVDERAPDKVDVDLHLNNCAPLERCASPHRLVQPAKSFTNVSVELRYSRESTSGEPPTLLNSYVCIKPIILVNDLPPPETEEPDAGARNKGAERDEGCGCASARTDHKRERLKKEIHSALYRRSYSIA